MTTVFATPGVLYELPLGNLELSISKDLKINFTHTLSSGRSNYILFQSLVALCAGWESGSEGGDSDLKLPNGDKAEVKAYYDATQYPSTARKYEDIHTAPSSTFGPNNKGPAIKSLLTEGKYADALAICNDLGYSKSDFYVYTNTREYTPNTPFRYLILETAQVLANLSPDDPRKIHRSTILSLATVTKKIDPDLIRLP